MAGPPPLGAGSGALVPGTAQRGRQKREGLLQPAGMGQAVAHDGVQARAWISGVAGRHRADHRQDGTGAVGQPLDEQAPGEQLVVPDRVAHQPQHVVDGADVGAALAEEGVVEPQQLHAHLL